MAVPNFLTVAQFCEKHRAFTEGGLRFQIFHAHSNGLADSGAIVRLGRKVLIDEDKYFDFVVNGQRASVL